MFETHKEFRPDIQGLRAIGALLIMIFHIWIPKVSGGVDVFFVISGFLMTQVFVGMLDRQGFSPLPFWTSIVGRIVPLAYLVMVATALASYQFVAPLYWNDALSHFWHAVLQVENWNLIEGQVSYLHRNSEVSPFQQYWALSLQMQFYLVLPFFLGLLWLIHKKVRRAPPVIAGLIVYLWVASFCYAVRLAEVDEKAAYFNSGARAWEFLTGIALALGRQWLRPTGSTANWLATLGLALLLLTGVVLPSGAPFPSWPALMPVLAAALVISTGGHATTKCFSWIRAPWLVKQGSYGFSIYLWHWPLLIFAQNWLNTRRLSFLEGSLLIVAALVLSRVTYLGFEAPLRKALAGRPRLTWVLTLSLIASTLGLAYGGNKALQEYLHPAVPELTLPVFSEPNPLLRPTLDLETVPLKKLIATSTDVTRAALNRCDLGRLSDEVIPCEFGDTKANRTIVLVGGSHASQWAPAFDILGKTRGFRLISITKHSCTLGYNMENDPTCDRWNESAMSALAALKPSLVVVVATRMPYLDEPWGTEYIPYGYIKKLAELDALGIPVLGLRDNPFYDYNPYTCAWLNADDLSACAPLSKDLYLPTNPALKVEAALRKFKTVDLSSLFCPDGRCYTVIDGIPVWRDNNHMTRSFVRYVAVRAGRLIDQQRPGTLPPEKLSPEILREATPEVYPSSLPDLIEAAEPEAEPEAEVEAGAEPSIAAEVAAEDAIR